MTRQDTPKMSDLEKPEERERVPSHKYVPDPDQPEEGDSASDQTSVTEDPGQST